MFVAYDLRLQPPDDMNGALETHLALSIENQGRKVRSFFVPGVEVCSKIL